jgi:hypothetical protein
MMRALPEIFASINKGASPRFDIFNRATLMRSHAEAGNVQRAEEYATEIERIALAYNARAGIATHWADWPAGPVGHVAWASAILGGAWLWSRRVHPDALPRPLALAA